MFAFTRLWIVIAALVFWNGVAWLGIAPLSFSQPHSILHSLARTPDFTSHRISSYDRTGGNNDRITIQPGETAVLAEIEGPGAITHIWNTISAERYASRMLILRMYWDGQETPSVEVPLGDFFGVGHGLEISFGSLPVAVSAEGRSRNCYWYMPFRESARITLTHEGFDPVRAFYYYIDYQRFEEFPDDALYFHAQYRQATPNPRIDLGGVNLDGAHNYVLLETRGRGQYAGTVLSVQTRDDGWFGEGDDMFFLDGETTPSIIGTGTEDYFNDAWGFREFDYPLHGVTLWEGYRRGDRGTAYKWHLFDPIAFQSSLKATIEHGHANDRQDDFTSVAFWYQTLPSPQSPPMANVLERLPNEGRLYAERRFLNRQVALHLDEDRLEQALARVEAFGQEHEGADEYGYISLRGGILLKHLDRLDDAKQAFHEARERSQKEDRFGEHDAEAIHAEADREYVILDRGRTARITIAGCDEYRLYLNGEEVGSGRFWDHVRHHEVDIRTGEAVIAVRCVYRGGLPGLALQLSHRRGYVITDEHWKYSFEEQTGWNDRRFHDDDWRNVEIAGRLGEGRWSSIREPYHFLAPLFLGNVISAPGWGAAQNTVYFRTTFRMR